MELSDRYELMPDDFKNVIKKRHWNLELYMNMYLNTQGMKPRRTEGWERLNAIISNNVIRCKMCGTIFIDNAKGKS